MCTGEREWEELLRVVRYSCTCGHRYRSGTCRGHVWRYVSCVEVRERPYPNVYVFTGDPVQGTEGVGSRVLRS